MKRIKDFIIVWALVLSFIGGVGLAVYLLRLLGIFAAWLSPVYGPYIFAILLITGSVSACMVGGSREKAGGAPY